MGFPLELEAVAHQNILFGHASGCHLTRLWHQQRWGCNGRTDRPTQRRFGLHSDRRHRRMRDHHIYVQLCERCRSRTTHRATAPAVSPGRSVSNDSDGAGDGDKLICAHKTNGDGSVAPG
jgi:hypothetical protein